jgi:1,4-dihydroxy-2-naphthoyl-CoA hydrolase
MAIWFRPYTLDEINLSSRGCLVEHLGIRVTELGDDFIRGEMPVDHRTKQPFGLLHGGASAALAETLCSIGTGLTLDPAKFYGVGLEINANHLRSCTGGNVVGTARPIHRGRTTQVWETRIEQGGKPVCISRMTLAVLTRSTASGPA